jgi:DNA-binding response OmpR family regulator
MKRKILILEDDSIFSFILKKSLEKLGFYAVVANDATQVWDIVSKENIDLFLFDLSVGHENGFEILEKLRELFPELKAIASTGRIVDDWKKYGIQGFLIKPYPIQELDLMLKNIFCENLI